MLKGIFHWRGWENRNIQIHFIFKALIETYIYLNFIFHLLIAGKYKLDELIFFIKKLI